VAAWADGRQPCTTAHSLAETFAVLTRLPGDARVDPLDAATLIDDDVVPATRDVRARATYDAVGARAVLLRDEG
jgi:toxin FitB